MAVLEAIGAFFMAIIRGIGWFFYAIWVGLKTVAITIVRVIIYVIGLMIRYFIIYAPVLVMAGFAIFWILNPEGPNESAYATFEHLDDVGYNFNLTVLAAEWIMQSETNIFLLIVVPIKMVITVVVAILETILVYVVFGVIGTLICWAFYLVYNVVIWFILPGAAVVYSAFMLKNSDSYNRWFYLLCTVLTTVCSVICYIYAFTALLA